jgi:hypothetical protein
MQGRPDTGRPPSVEVTTVASSVRCRRLGPHLDVRTHVTERSVADAEDTVGTYVWWPSEAVVVDLMSSFASDSHRRKSSMNEKDKRRIKRMRSENSIGKMPKVIIHPH